MHFEENRPSARSQTRHDENLVSLHKAIISGISSMDFEGESKLKCLWFVIRHQKALLTHFANITFGDPWLLTLPPGGFNINAVTLLPLQEMVGICVYGCCFLI